MAAQIGGKTQLTGLLGWPVSHTKSPAMHNAAAADLDLDLVYLALEVQPVRLAAAVRGLAALGFRGANVTVPHKQAVIPLLDVVDRAAAAIGAVNTIVIGDRAPTLTGHNTDWAGFLADLDGLGVAVAGQDCLILGAGGSARAVAYALASAGSRVHLFARREAQALKITTDLAAYCPVGSLIAHAWPALDKAASDYPSAALVVNTTPVGMTPNSDASPWPDSVALPKKAFIYDLVYNPAETQLMRQARAAGHQTSNGLGMLLHQGALAFQLWTGLEPNLQVMAGALDLA